MNYQVSARKYRPQAFSQVVGQGHIVRTLTNAISAGRVAHAYLFSGIRGVGKTTVARIFAKALNCENGPATEPCNQCEHCKQVTDGHSADVMEIDGASNNSVDNIRELSDNIRYRPLACRYKIYIIDEVHMLSTQAFNALLKTLEEPPEHAVFIFATTETHKIPQTILSRCQQHAFRRVSREEIIGHLTSLAETDGITAPRTALGLVARTADGSLRDALSLFDQAVSFGGGALTDDDVTLMLGVAGQPTLTAFADDILYRDAASALIRLKNLVGRGHDLQTLAAQLVEHFRNMLVCKVTKNPEALMDLSGDDIAEIAKQALAAPREVLEQVLALLSDAQERCRRALNPGFVLEAALVRACHAMELTDLSELIARMDAVAEGQPAIRRASADLPPRSTSPAVAEAAPDPVAPTPIVAPAGEVAAPVQAASVQMERSQEEPDEKPQEEPDEKPDEQPTTPPAEEPAPPSEVPTPPVEVPTPAPPEAAAPAPEPQSAPMPLAAEAGASVPPQPVVQSAPVQAAPQPVAQAPAQPEPVQQAAPPAPEPAKAAPFTPPAGVPPAGSPSMPLFDEMAEEIPADYEMGGQPDRVPAPAAPTFPEPAPAATITPPAGSPAATFTPSAGPSAAPVMPPAGSPPARSVASSAGPLTAEGKAVWTAVVKHIRTRRAPLAAYLEQGVLQSVSESAIVVAYPVAFEVMHSMVSRKENNAFITRVATEVAKRPMSVSFATVKEASENVTTLAQEFEAEKQAAHRAEVEKAMDLPFVKDVLDTFGGEVVELHKPES